MTQLDLQLEGAAPARRMAGPCLRCGCAQGLHHRSRGRCLDCGCPGYRGQSFEILDLDHFDPQRLARRTDPASSQRAAMRALVSGLAQGHDRRIVDALREAARPMTAKEIGACTSLTNVQVCRRLGPSGKLRSAGLVRLVPGPGEQHFETAR